MNKIVPKNKLEEIEWIRAVCCLLVVIIHVTAEYWTSFSKGSFQFKFIILLNTISQFAVPCFVFISAFVLYYVYHNREYKILDFYKKRMSKIIIPYLIWSGIYIFTKQLFYNTPIDFKSIVKYILIGRASSHLYFIVLIIQFYLAFPLLLKFYQKINNKFVSTGILIIINVIVMMFIKMPFKDRFFMNYLMFIGLGFLLADLKIQGFKANKILKISIFSLYLSFTLYYFLDRYNDITQISLMYRGLYRYAWWIFSVISIISIYLFANMLKDIKYDLVDNKIIKSLSKHSFNIYLSHMFFMAIFRNFKGFDLVKNYSMTLGFILQLVIITGVSWMTSIALEKR